MSLALKYALRSISLNIIQIDMFGKISIGRRTYLLDQMPMVPITNAKTRAPIVVRAHNFAGPLGKLKEEIT